MGYFQRTIYIICHVGLVLEGVDDDVGMNSFTGDAFRLKVRC